MFACALESLLLGEGKNLLTVNISGYIAQCVASVEEHRTKVTEPCQLYYVRSRRHLSCKASRRRTRLSSTLPYRTYHPA
ncbi:hypothetical protein T4A_4057 [Trichinella pseudospiralis]|uniref:Uncharacterized protein n=1 Tax=Trichinella pseudospiralis TaxID=6337 RepID=A0A0V1ER52_TRIPS|nr:hypothetical protein T4A_4057 [Trichinella pseudospiralis]KRY92044.1 hypothetical protein T4D_10860 [Trichinella pseudospiralis]